jgi:hypothetical protein
MPSILAVFKLITDCVVSLNAAAGDWELAKAERHRYPLNHIVRAQHLRDREVERFASLEIDHQLEFGRLLALLIGRLSAGTVVASFPSIRFARVRAAEASTVP